MPLSWNEIRNRAHEFSKRWEGESSERAVNACYRKAAFTSDAQRVEFLFERYRQLTSLLPTAPVKKARKPKA